MNNTQVDNVNKKPRALPEEIFEAIHAVMHLFRTEQYRSFRDGPYELTHMEGRTLAFIARHPGATPKDLMEHSGRDKGQLTRLLKTLKEQKLVVEQANPSDKRSVRLSLSDKGAAIHKHLQNQVKRLANVAVKGFSTAEQETLDIWLRKVKTNLERLNDKPNRSAEPFGCEDPAAKRMPGGFT